MADTLFERPGTSRVARDVTAWDRLKVHRDWLGMWFMLPALAILILFLAYPLGLGVWLSFTDARIGRTGAFIGIENYEWLWGDSVFWLSVFNTLLYTVVASIIKFAVGLYLAVLLNHSLPFKAIIRSVVLIPFIVPPCSRRSRSGGSTTASSPSSHGRCARPASSPRTSIFSATLGTRAGR